MIDALLKKFCRWNRYRAWSDGSIWLSLDRFERFWPDAGLALSNGEAVKSAVREALRTKYAMDAAHRARVALNPGAPVDMVYRNRIQTLPKGCITNIAETAGMPDAECFAKWILGPVHKAITWPSSGSWSAELYHLSKEEPDMLVSRYKVAGETARKIVDIAARHRSEIDAIKERTEAVDREPLSGWDAVAYADYRNDDPTVNPLSGLWPLLRYLCFDRAWAEVVRCTCPANIDALIQWGYTTLGPNRHPYEQAAIPEDVRAAWHMAWLD